MVNFTADKLKQSREAGYSDDEIWGFLSEQDERFNKTKEAGYSLDEVSGFFSEQQAPQETATPTEPAPPVGTSFFEEVAAIPQALRQSIEQPTEAMGETAEVLGMPALGRTLRGAVEAPEGYVPAAQRFMQPQEGEFQIGGFAPQFLPRAIVEQAGQIGGAILTRAAGAAIGGLAGSTVGPKGTVAGAVAGSFLGPALFEMSQIVGPVARERATNQGREEPTTDDLAWAWSTAGASGALNAIGAKYLPNGDKLVGGLANRIATAVAGEGTTEGLQNVVQQTGQTFLTESGFKLEPKETIGEAIIGGGAAGGAVVVAAPFTPTPEAKAAAAAETKVAAEQAAPVAPETAQVVSEQANQVIAQAQAEETTETPDETVARLQREAQEAAGEIELEEEPPVSGLPPVEPTPTAEAPIEPVVAEGEAQPITATRTVEDAIRDKDTFIYNDQRGAVSVEDGVTVFRPFGTQDKFEIGINPNQTIGEIEGIQWARKGQARAGQIEAKPETATIIESQPAITTDEVDQAEPDFEVPPALIEIEKSQTLNDLADLFDTGDSKVVQEGKRARKVSETPEFYRQVTPQQIGLAQRLVDNALRIIDALPVSDQQKQDMAEPYLLLDQDITNYENNPEYQRYKASIRTEVLPAGEAGVFPETETEVAAGVRELEQRAKAEAERLERAVGITPVAPTPVTPPVTPQLEPLRRVARAEQTEEDVAGLVDAGFVEVYNGQPVLTQAGLDALPEAERPRLTPEARKIQIDTRTSEAAAEAISKNLRIGVDQVPADVRMPAGWTLVGDVYIPPTRMAKIETFDVETLAEVDEDSDVFADVIKRKDQAKAAVVQKPEGSAFATQEEFRAAFDLRGEGHGRFATRLDLMVADGVITSEGRDLIMAVIYDNNTDDVFLNNMEMGSFRNRVTSAYGRGGASRQTVESAKGKAIGVKPSLRMIRNARKDLDIDARTAQTLSTFWHEFGHAGYYSLLDKAQKDKIASIYRKTTKAQREKFFGEGVAAARQENVTARYYAKSETEWFAQSFAEYVLTKKSDQKGLVPIFESILTKIKGVFGRLFSRKEGTPELEDIFEYIIQGKDYGTTKVWWNGMQMSLSPALYGVGGAQPVDPQFSKRLLEREKQNRARARRSITAPEAIAEEPAAVGEIPPTAEEPIPVPTFTEGTPEAATLKEMATSMAKVDAASEAKGGKPETQKISDIAANWMDQGGDERALQDVIVENTNLTPANAARVAKAIARQYDIQQSIATAFLETPTGLSVEAIPEGATLPPEVDPDRPKPVMVRLFETYMGVKVPPTKLTVNEKTALRDQIRLKAVANREAKKAQQATQAEVIDIIKAMELRGPVRPKQAAALAKRAAKVIWTSEKSMEAFVNYAEKVVINTNYDADLREAKAAQKRAQQLSKSEKVAAPQREVLADIAKIGVNMLDNPAEFAAAVNHYLRGFKSVVSPDYVVIPDAEITSYLSAMQTEADANKAEFDRATNERLAIKYGIPLNELEKYLNAENIIRDLASYARREVVEGILTEKAQETLVGLKAYDQTQLRDEQRKILDEMVKVDPRNLDSEERQRFVRIGNNIIFNNQTNGAEYFVATAKGQQMAREMAKDETAIAKNKAWVNLLPSIVSPKLQRGWALELQSVADTFRNAFGKGAMGKVYRMMGMLDLNMAQTKANTQLDQIQEEISAFYNGLEKKYKAAARNQDGILAEGVVGFLIQKVPEKGETESLAQRRNLIQQDIRNRREDPDRVEMANRIEALLQQLDGATVQDILNNLKQNYRPNYDSLMFLKDTLFPKYKEFLKRFDENFNDQANNYENPDYLPIGFVRAGPSLAITEEETGQFYDHVSLRPKQSSYTIKRADYTQLPTDQSTNTPKEIEFNLRRNAFDSLSDQITKAYTNPAWQRINAFLKTPEAESVFGGRANKDFFIERLNRLRLSRMRRGALSRGYIEKTADVVSVIARKLGTGIALGGVYQTFKQAPDQLITTLATTGRRDLLGKNAMDVLAQQLAPKTLRESTKMLNKFSIGRRGDASAGYKYINQMEGAQTRMERYFTESNWDKAKEQGSKIADIWMVALKKSDFVAAAGSWLTYYRADLAKRGIKFEGWEREAELVDTDPARQDSAAYAEQMTDIYQGSSDPTQMATFAQSGKSGWENLWKSMFVPFNSFAVQQRMRLYSDARDALTKTGVDQKTGYLGLSGTIGGMILFHMVKRLFIPTLSGLGVGVLYGVMGVDVEEPDEEKKKEDLNKRWRQMQGEILANMLVGGTGQIIEAKTIDAFNYAAYLISVQTENESVLDDNGEVMPFSTYVKERSPFWRYQSFDSAYSLGMLEIGLGQAEKAVTQSKMLMDSEEMENFTPEEQRLLYFAAVSEWLYTMRLNDADFARLVDKARRDMIKAAKEREKELQRIRSGR